MNVSEVGGELVGLFSKASKNFETRTPVKSVSDSGLEQKRKEMKKRWANVNIDKNKSILISSMHTLCQRQGAFIGPFSFKI